MKKIELSNFITPFSISNRMKKSLLLIGFSFYSLCMLSGFGELNNNNSSNLGSETSLAPPVANCKDVTVELDMSGSVTVAANAFDDGSTGDAPLVFSAESTEVINGIDYLTLLPATFDCSHGGIRNVTMTVEDVNGLTSDCNAKLTIEPYSGTTRWHVDASIVDAGGGMSWDCAFKRLQDALHFAKSGDEIWVADGTYYPDESRFGLTSNNDRTHSFELKDGVAIYGGFAGGETMLSSRNWATNKAILNGDLMKNDGANFTNYGDNAYHVVQAIDAAITATAVLDGFTISAGNADGAGGASLGGGLKMINASPSIANCIFTKSRANFAGGGVQFNNSSTTFLNCTFLGNYSGSNGAGVKFQNSSPVLNRCSFIGNETAGAGGGFFHSDGNPLVATNCIFSGNKASTGAGGQFQGTGTIGYLTNCSFSGNQANNGGAAIGTYNSSIIITNCVMWGNSSDITTSTGATATAAYSIIEGGYAGTGNLDVDPLFVSQPDFNTAPTIAGDLRLQQCSPAIDEGDNAANSTPTDLDDLTRIVNATGSAIIDMGAFELQSSFDLCTQCFTSGSIIYVDENAMGNNDGTSWTDAFNYLQDALALAQTCTNATEIWVADGTYYPDEGAGVNNNDRTTSFHLLPNVAIYGGFAGGETMLSSRNWLTNKAILNGDIDKNNTKDSGNAYHVVKSNSVSATSILDGFTITMGFADDFNTYNDSGAGMENINSSPTIANCIFTENESFLTGGGIFNDNASPIITNCAFIANVSFGGGGLGNTYGSAPSITNCEFRGNAAQEGGGMWNSASSPSIVNSSFSGNDCGCTAGAISNNASSSPVITNSIIWENAGNEIDGGTPTVSHSIVKGGFVGTDNLDSDPLFISQPSIGLGTGGDLRLQPCSPAIDLGSNGANATTEDLDDNPRVVNALGTATIDMGAYEYQSAVNVCVCVPASGVIFVDQNATGLNNGRTWDDAFNYLQDALTLASACSGVTEIWVADGTYYPDEGVGFTDNDRNHSFELINGVAIYGGFAGGEPSLSNRDWNTNMAILSGDLMQNDGAGFSNYEDNAYHVVKSTGASITSTTILDGLTVSSGNADGSGDNEFGSGIFNSASAPLFRHLSITSNSGILGGGIANIEASPSLDNCQIFSNKTSISGGGIYNEDASPVFTNCKISGNQARFRGGGIYNINDCQPIFKNCTITGNRINAAGGFAGAFYNQGTDCAPTLINCTLSGNRAPSAAGFFNTSPQTVIENCIFTNNITNANSIQAQVSNSIIRFGYPGTGNFHADPLFVDQPPNSAAPTTAGDFHLQECSPAIDMGDNSANLTTEDLDNNPRIVNALGTATIDMGAYEYQSTVDICSCVPVSGVIFVDKDATGLDNGRTWDDAFNHLQDALDLAGNCSNITEIWVADGTYFPDEGQNVNNNNKNESFNLVEGVDVYGGFAGGEPSLSQRNWETNVTILSGEIGNLSINDDNSLHVVTYTGAFSSTRLDGFTITKGHAHIAGGGPDDVGGGLLSVISDGLTVANCKFVENEAYDFGGAVFTFDSDPVFENCQFLNNNAYDGGAVCNEKTSPSFNNCYFEGNEADHNAGAVHNYFATSIFNDCTFHNNGAYNDGGALFNTACGPEFNHCLFTSNGCSDDGGAIYNDVSDILMIDCAFIGNGSIEKGGAIYNKDSYPDFINITFAYNSGEDGGAVYNQSYSEPTFYNVIAWGNSAVVPTSPQSNSIFVSGNSSITVSNSMIEHWSKADLDGTGGSGNIDSADPLFVVNPDPGDGNWFTIGNNNYGDLQLQDCSPAIDRGEAAINPHANDLGGNPRLHDAIIGGAQIDMGAYEFQGTYSLPVASCQNQTVQLNASGNGTLDVSLLTDGSTGCEPIDFKVGVESTLSFDCTDIGNHTVTLKVTDNNGYTSTCSATVEVQDIIAPHITCPADIIVNTETSQCSEIIDFTATATDVCTASPLISYSQNPGTLFFNGTTTVTATADDGNGNASSCSFDVTLIEDVLIECQDVNTQLDDLGNVTITPEMVLSLPTPDVTLNYTGDLQSWTVPAGVTSVRIEAAGARGGNSFSKNGGKGAAVAGNFDVTPGTTYQLIVGEKGGKKSVSGGGGGATFIAAGNAGYSDFTANNILIIAGGGGGARQPISGKGAIIYQNTPYGLGGLENGGNGGASAELDGDGPRGGKAAVNGALGGSSSILGARGGYGGGGGGHSGGGGGGGATGGNGGPSSKAGLGGTSYNGGESPANFPAANNNHGYINIYYNYSPSNYSVSPNIFGCAEVGTVQSVTVTHINCDNSTSTCTSNVQVKDITPPQAICQPNTVQLDANGSVTLNANDLDGGSSDLCGIVSYTAKPAVLDCSNIGTNTVTLTVEDIGGNTSTCTSTVTVVDNGGLTITCPANITRECNQSTSSVWTGTATASDNCAASPLISESDASNQGTSGCNYYSYTITRTWTADDGNGNTVACDQVITVVDSNGPAVTCPATVTVECDADHSPANTGTATAVDNCDTQPAITHSDAATAGNCAQTWIITRTWTATDACGNSNSCDQVITVEDTNAPVISCPNDVTVECDADNSSAATGSATATDNCSAVGDITISESEVTAAGSCANATVITRTWTATDECGNPSSCDQVITVEDSQGPSITCPANMTVECSDDHSSANTGAAAATDNCSSAGDISINEVDATAPGNCANAWTITRTWTATDACGNSSSCGQTITVEDTTAPVMACGTLTVTPGADGTYALSQAEINGLGTGSTDNCGTIAFTAAPSSFDCADEGANSVTLTGTDDCGNSASCSATVTVNEFLQITSSASSDESCAGANDGTVDVTAHAPGGQLMFSIDGGANWQGTGSFTDLAPGTYTVTVKVFGIPGICEKSINVPVDAGGQPSTWYLDADGDGWTDYNASPITSCNQPAGYAPQSASADCNDSNADVYPGAPELCDGLDNDCDGVIPADETDADGDGYMVCDNDCNDTDAAVNPGATEICNGIDDDCDGEVDEGVSGGLTWTGNVNFTTQAEVDAWLACYSIIDGNLTIMGGGITDLSNLIGLEEVTGLVFIYANSSLTSLDGLDNLATVGNGLSIYYNFALADCCAIYELLNNGGVTGAITIFFNAAGCNSEAEIIAECGGNSLVSAPNNGTGASEGMEVKGGTTGAGMVLYPNPSNGAFTVVIPQNMENGKLTIMDLFGRTISVKPIIEGQKSYGFEVQSIKPGVYMVVADSPGIPVQAMRLVVE